MRSNSRRKGEQSISGDAGGVAGASQQKKEPKVEINSVVSNTKTINKNTKDISAPAVVEPLSPQELKEMLAKSKESEDDDCLMCGS